MKIHRFARCERGAATVEAAVAVPLLLLIGLGGAEMGNFVNEAHKMKTGLAAGARLLARASAPEATEASARNLAVTGLTTANGTPRVRGWTAAQVTVSYRWVANTGAAYTGGAQIRIVRLESTTPYRGLGLLPLVTGSSVSAAHEERWTG